MSVLHSLPWARQEKAAARQAGGCQASARLRCADTAVATKMQAVRSDGCTFWLCASRSLYDADVGCWMGHKRFEASGRRQAEPAPPKSRAFLMLNGCMIWNEM